MFSRLLFFICFISTFARQNQCLRITGSFDTQKFNYPEVLDEYVNNLRELSKIFGFEPAPLSDTSVTLKGSPSSPDTNIKIDLKNGQVFGLSNLTVAELHVEMTTNTSASVKLTVPEIKCHYVCSTQNALNVCVTVNTTLQDVDIEMSAIVDLLAKNDLFKISAKIVKIGKTYVKIEDGTQKLTDAQKIQLSSAMPNAIQEGLSHTLENVTKLVNSFVPDVYKKIVNFVQANLTILKAMSNFSLQKVRKLESELVSSATSFITKFGFSK